MAAKRHKREPTAAQIKAVASPLRLRILRLCNDREWTNQELARRLGKDPATTLHHLRVLVDAGLLAPTGVRQGRSGALEKPYRSTGLTWHLSFQQLPEDEEGELAILAAVRQELQEAGNQSVAESTRFHLHLDAEALASFNERFLALVEEYQAGDGARLGQGAPGYGGLFLVHRLADQLAPPPSGRV